MPIDYQRDDHRHLITVTLTDPFSFDELLSQTNRQWTEHTWEYAVLYDSRVARQVTPASEFQQLLNQSQVIGGGQPRGPVGVAILPRPEILRHGLQLARLAGPLRDIEILLNDAQIDAWLARHALRRADPPNDR